MFSFSIFKNSKLKIFSFRDFLGVEFRNFCSENEPRECRSGRTSRSSSPCWSSPRGSSALVPSLGPQHLKAAPHLYRSAIKFLVFFFQTTNRPANFYIRGCPHERDSVPTRERSMSFSPPENTYYFVHSGICGFKN